MKLNQHLKDWKQLVSGKFPNLSLPQVNGLATWSEDNSNGTRVV